MLMIPFENFICIPNDFLRPKIYKISFQSSNMLNIQGIERRIHFNISIMNSI